MRRMYGEEWLKRVLFDNEASFVRRPEGAAILTARGEYAISGPIGFKVPRNILNDTPSAPIRFLIPEEGASGSLLGFGMIKNAPHPNAVRVYINWYMSAEGMSRAAKTHLRVPLRFGTKVPYPEFQAPNKVKFLEPLPPSFEVDLKKLPQMRKVFKKMRAAAKK